MFFVIIFIILWKEINCLSETRHVLWTSHCTNPSGMSCLPGMFLACYITTKSSLPSSICVSEPAKHLSPRETFLTLSPVLRFPALNIFNPKPACKHNVFISSPPTDSLLAVIWTSLVRFVNLTIESGKCSRLKVILITCDMESFLIENSFICRCGCCSSVWGSYSRGPRLTAPHRALWVGLGSCLLGGGSARPRPRLLPDSLSLSHQFKSERSDPRGLTAVKRETHWGVRPQWWRSSIQSDMFSLHLSFCLLMSLIWSAGSKKDRQGGEVLTLMLQALQSIVTSEALPADKVLVKK